MLRSNLNLSSVSLTCCVGTWPSTHFRRCGLTFASVGAARVREASRAVLVQTKYFHGRGAGPNGGSCSRLCLHLRRMLQQVQQDPRATVLLMRCSVVADKVVSAADGASLARRESERARERERERGPEREGE